MRVDCEIKKSVPLVTVLMPVYNGKEYLSQAIESILDQTFSCFNFLIIDDASSDATSDILCSYAGLDKRICIVRNEKNLGLTASLNKGLELVQSPYIVRMDADDISLPSRLAEQVAFLENNPQVVVLGSYCSVINENGDVIGEWSLPTAHEEIIARHAVGISQLAHPAAMIRTEVLKACGGYRECLPYSQDYDLWLRFEAYGRLANFPRVLHCMRQHVGSITKSKVFDQSVCCLAAFLSHQMRKLGKLDMLDKRTAPVTYKEILEWLPDGGPEAWLCWLERSAQWHPVTEWHKQALLTAFSGFVHSAGILKPPVRDRVAAALYHALARYTGIENELVLLLEGAGNVWEWNKILFNTHKNMIYDVLREKQRDVLKLKEEIAAVRVDADAVRLEISQIHSSRSWRIAMLIRGPANFIRRTTKSSISCAHACFSQVRQISGAFTHSRILQKGLSREKMAKFWHYLRRYGIRRTLFRIMQEVRAVFRIRQGAKTVQMENYLESPSPVSNVASTVKAIAFYLPQFHPIPENDTWWGEGFTEWSNVAKATPLFSGHHQPKLPGALGFYDLRLPEIMRMQADLAKKFGIHGFCFHYYWFAGKRLLERPIEQFLADPSINIPFCLNWANENWTRRWDGFDAEILIKQKHSIDDDVAIIRDFLRHFRDPRYIRIDNRPVLLVYRASLLPDMKATLERWREECRQQGEFPPYFVMVQSFENYDPRIMGFDAAVQFPPHLPPESGGYPSSANVPTNLVRGFQGQLVDYDSMIETTLRYYDPSLPAYPCISPAWDNTARRSLKGTVFVDSSPQKYAKWLDTVAGKVIDHFPSERRFVFINAWNEWAEGAYLEPDSTYGYAYLNATSRTLASLSDAGKVCIDPKHRLRILFVGHDAALAGAQILLLHVIKWLKRHAAVDAYLILLEGGPLKAEYEKHCPVFLCNKSFPSKENLDSFCSNPDIIYGNTAVAACCYDSLTYLNVPILTHVHELENSLKKFATPDILQKMRAHSDYFIAASTPVKDNLIANHEINSEIVLVVDAFIEADSNPLEKDKEALRRAVNLPSDGYLVVGCGSLDWRKGPDLFVEVAYRVIKALPSQKIYFCWVGAGDDPAIPSPEELAKKYGIADKVIFVGQHPRPKDFFQAADLFLLTSREDPFPLVALEACECSLPVICFTDSGGMPAFIATGPGFVVPFENVEAMADKAVELLCNKTELKRVGQTARTRLMETHTTDIAVPYLLGICRALAQKPHPVSVIVPNYNYEFYLPQRLESIFQQTFRDMEVIVLDDFSSDNSLTVIHEWKKRTASFHLIINEENSGNVSLQWKKGIEKAHGSYIWIAEADDCCSSDFLANLLIPMQDPEVVLSYTIPTVIDSDGKNAFLDYRQNYLKYADAERWKRSYIVDGMDEILAVLGVVNCIPNVSAALFRKPEDSVAIDVASQFLYSGDWMFYLQLARDGRIAYVHGNFAQHRRHTQSVIASDTQKKYEKLRVEIERIHTWIRNSFPMTAETQERMASFLKSIN